jgi:ribosome-associated translation inhibitor RaiA
MTASSNIKLTIQFTDPQLDAEERDEQAQLLIDELKDIDEIDRACRVIDPTPPPEGSKAIGTYLVGLLMAQMNIDNAKKAFEFLRDRLDNKSIELTIEANGKKLSVKASSREELDYAIQAAEKFIAA